MDWLFSEIWSTIKPLIGNFFSQLKIKNDIRKISDELNHEILEAFGNEIYFNDLDRFLYNNKVISNFINSCKSTSTNDYESINSYINTRVDRFIHEYPHYHLHKNIIAATIEKIFRMTFEKLNTIDQPELRSVTNILKEYIVYVDNKLSNIEKKGDEILSLLQDNFLKEGNVPIENITSITTAPFVFPEIDMNYICKRDSVIQEILDYSSQNNWIHIKGSTWSGKTFTAILLSKKLENSLWIDFSYGDPRNIINSFMKSYDIQSLSTEGYTIVIDNLPELNISSPFTYVFISFLTHIISKNCKIISFGLHHNLRSNIVQNGIQYKQLDLVEFSSSDVAEIMTIYDVPEFLRTEKTCEFILEIAGKKPAVIIIIFQYLRENNWNLHDETFFNVLKLDIEELTQQINNIVCSTILDEGTRELLYRISFAGHSVTQEELQNIALITPDINHVGEKLSILKGIWLSGDKIISANSILKNVSNDNLSPRVKIDINNVLANSLLSKRVLDQFDINRLICHLIGANRIDEAGQTYMRAMQSMCEDDIEYDDTYIFSLIWRNMPLPEEMDILIQAGVRYFQIWYDVSHGKENEYSVAHLLELARENSVVRELVLMIAAILVNKNKKLAMQLISSLNSDPIKIEFKCFEGTTLKPIESTVALLFININELSDLSEWFVFIKNNITSDIIKDFDDSEHAYIFDHGFEKIRSNLCAEQVERFTHVINEIYDYAHAKLWVHLETGCLVTLLKIESINKLDYNNTKYIYNEFVKNTSHPIVINNIRYCMGLLAMDNQDYSYALECLCKVIVSPCGLDEFDKIICSTNCSIAFTRKSMFYEAKASINHSIVLTQNNCKNNDNFPLEILFKNHFERIIVYYLSDDFTNALDSLEYINEYINNNEISGNEHLIAVALHCIAYIHDDIIHNRTPKLLNDDIYLPPHAGIMWFQNNADIFVGDNIEVKKILLNIMSAQLLNHYGENNIADKLLICGAQQIININDPDVFLFISMNGYTLYRLFEIKEYDLGIQIFDHMFHCYTINDINDEFRINNNIIKLSFYFIAYYPTIDEIFERIYQSNILQSLKDINPGILEIFDLFHKNIIPDWISLGTMFHSKNNSLLQAICYVFATHNTSSKQLINIYFAIFSTLGDIICNDTYWLNYILVPLLKKQFSEFDVQNKNDYGFSTTNILAPLNDYIYNINAIKNIFKKYVSIYGENSFHCEYIKWLNN